MKSTPTRENQMNRLARILVLAILAAVAANLLAVGLARTSSASTVAQPSRQYLACVRAVADERRLLGPYAIGEVACVPDSTTTVRGVGGLSTPGFTAIATNPSVGYDFYRQVVAHEFGHQYQFAIVPDLSMFAAVRGISTSDAVEDFADVFAYANGEWKRGSDGRDWRTAGTRPTTAQIETLRADGILPGAPMHKEH